MVFAMNTQTLYRKHRPQAFTDVIGQDHIVQMLQGALQNNKIGHAYLFIGTRGIGKTTLARIFASEIGISPEDTYEIDGASHRKIEDIRALREAVATLPFNSAKKVYIIDEVHMLTKEAFNALLKTLEEPPSHVIFMLATTEPDRIPATIISRCQVMRLHTPTVQTISTLLIQTAKKEQKELDDDAAVSLAFLADGSFRDALGVLQQVLDTTQDTNINNTHIASMFGLADHALIENILLAIVKKDAETFAQLLQKLPQGNMANQLLLKRTTRIIRTLLRMQYAPAQKDTLLKQATNEEVETLTKISAVLDTKFTSSALKILLDGIINLGTLQYAELTTELVMHQLWEKGVVQMKK